jgi:2-polyprenyl-3-methyl-5-hydroxy-6-metoxy-1,4-benzoquinol methylase
MTLSSSSVEIYSGYEAWKGWNDLFHYTPDKADYFSGETRGLAVADADVLEIGFGSGDFLQWAIDRGARVAATEINPVLLKAASERSIELIEADFERISDTHAGRFDTIVAFDVFEHFSYDEVITRLRAAGDMLKPGGHLVMRFPNAQSPFGLAPQHGDPTHRSYLSRSVFEQLIQGSVFEIARYGHPYRAKGRTPAVFFARLVRHVLRDLISACLNAIYTTRIPYDAVVVLVLRKKAA